MLCYIIGIRCRFIIWRSSEETGLFFCHNRAETRLGVSTSLFFVFCFCFFFFLPSFFLSFVLSLKNRTGQQNQLDPEPSDRGEPKCLHHDLPLVCQRTPAVYETVKAPLLYCLRVRVPGSSIRSYGASGGQSPGRGRYLSVSLSLISTHGLTDCDLTVERPAPSCSIGSRNRIFLLLGYAAG